MYYLAAGDLERQIATSMSVKPEQVAAAALSRYGRSVTEERDERARKAPNMVSRISRDVAEEIALTIGRTTKAKKLAKTRAGRKGKS